MSELGRRQETLRRCDLLDRWSQRVLSPPQRAQTAQRSTGATVPSGINCIRVPSAASL